MDGHVAFGAEVPHTSDGDVEEADGAHSIALHLLHGDLAAGVLLLATLDDALQAGAKWLGLQQVAP